MKTNEQFHDQVGVFYCKDATKEEVIVAGEKALLQLYNAGCCESFNALRWRFCQKVATGNAFLQPENLPPTPSAATRLGMADE